MSAIGGLLGSLGGPQVAAAIVAGGLVVGALGGAAASGIGGASTPATATGQLPVYLCPGSGSPVAVVQKGQRLLVTGRSADGTYVRIHLPDPGQGEGWVQMSPLTFKGAVDSVPVAGCLPELAIAAPSVSPAESMTAVEDNSPTPSPTPTPAPPNVIPGVGGLKASTAKLSYDTANYCPTGIHTVTFTVNATDDVGITGVVLGWRKPGATTDTRTPMTLSKGSATSGTWTVSLNATADGITKAGKLTYYALATDTAGATKRIPVKGSSSITVVVCANTGPTISSVASSAGSNLYWDPLGVASCQTATNITAAVKDVDNVKSVTLFFKRPGSSTWSSKPMNNTTVAGKWYANLDTLGDKITITSPPTDPLTWYIKAVDGKNLAAQTKTASITIRRCDSEALFDGVFPNSGYACGPTTLQIATYANDRDQPNDGLKVVFHWTLTNPRTGAGPISGKMSANLSKGNFYQGTTASFDGKTYYYATLKAYAVTTDIYGGTTTSPTFTTTISCG